MVRDRISEYLTELTRAFDIEKGIVPYTAEAIAQTMELKRNTISGYLNQLVEEGRLIKIISRPVCFFDRKVMEEILDAPIYASTFSSLDELMSLKQNRNGNIFMEMAGADGSLESVIKQVKIAVKYPPAGLPLLIQGNTGVGKSYLASLAYRYAIDQGILSSDAPFLTFNCAQYYNNAELLSSNLFGYMKGSYTGAVADKKGLLEEADGGIIFMDEVHRLTPEGQEKLFIFMDKGVFRRMGETSGWRTSKVRFIFASNKDASSYMLQTFYRRNPIIVQIPDLKDRSGEEKLQMIYQYFLREAGILKKEILVSRTVLQDMQEFRYDGNVGELINIIQYMCGSALLNSEGGDIHITRECYPDYLFAQIKNREISEAMEEIRISPGGDTRRLIHQTNPVYKASISFFRQQLILYHDVKSGKSNWKDFEKNWREALGQYTDQLFFQRQYMEQKKICFYEDIIRRYCARFSLFTDKVFTDEAVTVASMYLLSSQEQFAQSPEEQKACHAFLEQLKIVYGDAYRQTKDFLVYLEKEEMGRRHLEDQIFFTLYFRMGGVEQQEYKTAAYLACTSGFMAYTMAAQCNRRLGKTVFKPVDLGTDAEWELMVCRLREIVKQCREQEILIFIDMPFLDNPDIMEQLEAELRGTEASLGIIIHINMEAMIWAGRLIMENKTVMEILSEGLDSYAPQGKLIHAMENRKRLIITTCISGEGTAQKIKNLLEASFFDVPWLRIRSMDFEHLKDGAICRELKSCYNLLAIVGTDDPGIQDIPFIPIDKLIMGEDEGSLSSLFGDSISTIHREKINNRLVANFSLENMVGSITIIDARILMQDIEAFLERFERYTQETYRNNLKMNLFIHISAMMERLVRSSPIRNCQNLESIKEQNPEFIERFKRAFSLMQRKYGVEINDEEIGIIYQIIKNARKEK